MAKNQFVGEFEFKASKKMLFPYFSTASGLAQWFADDVNINEDKVYTFIWDGEETKAKLTSNRTNHHVRFDVVDEEEEDDPNFFEFKIEMNELTQTVYVKITDYSDMEDEEAHELWESLTHDLKEIVGG